MTENSLLYQFYTSRRLNDAEIQLSASMLLSCEPTTLKSVFSKTLGPTGSEIMMFTSDNGSILTIRFYESKLFYSADVVMMDPSTKPDLSFIRQIETKLREYLQKLEAYVRVNCLFSPIRRGQSLWRYFVTADERLYEAKVDALVADVDTEYQNVKIYRSPLHGHVLYLDDDVMFGESDQEAYTRVLLGVETGKPARNSFEGREILILGGGDGGVMCELLRHRPRLVVMCEIDKTVVSLCSKFMRSACGDALDQFQAENKQIIIGDCLQHLHECIQSGKKYDFIINDLTEFPVNKEQRGWVYDFATDNSQVLELSLKALKPDGRYLSRGGTEAGDFFWKVFESDCEKLGLKFTVSKSYVPSFYEDYRLYEVSFK